MIFFGFFNLQFFTSEKGKPDIFSLRLWQTCETVSSVSWVLFKTGSVDKVSSLPKLYIRYKLVKVLGQTSSTFSFKWRPQLYKWKRVVLPWCKINEVFSSLHILFRYLFTCLAFRLKVSLLGIIPEIATFTVSALMFLAILIMFLDIRATA